MMLRSFVGGAAALRGKRALRGDAHFTYHFICGYMRAGVAAWGGGNAHFKTGGSPNVPGRNMNLN